MFECTDMENIYRIFFPQKYVHNLYIHVSIIYQCIQCENASSLRALFCLPQVNKS